MQLAKLVATADTVAATRSRLKKIAALTVCLRHAGPAEVVRVTAWLSGELLQGRIGLGPALVRDAASPPAATATLTLQDVDATFEQIAVTTGAGSRAARQRLLASLFARATSDEQSFLFRLLLGELRQGALEGVMTEAIAGAAELPAADVRRAVMLAGDVSAVAGTALAEGSVGLERYRLQPGSPVRPMLAQPAEDIAAALGIHGTAIFEHKLDGARVQVHRVEDTVRIYTRKLNDVTAGLPDIVGAVTALGTGNFILDGEVIALRPDGRPHPFQDTMRRFGRRLDVERVRAKLPLSVFFFDVLHHAGEDLIDLPARARLERLDAFVPAAMRMPRTVSADAGDAGAFMRAALDAGHEGVMAKSLDAVYEAGNRGAAWLKIKPTHTLDLVVLAAEWGSGRRKGWLSNLHLGARDPAGGFVMLGKTFKGLTDEMLAWQTRELLSLEQSREGHVVHVRPELVVEIAFNELQASRQYPGGLALRFARVKGYRTDKNGAEADTIDTVRAIYSS